MTTTIDFPTDMQRRVYKILDGHGDVHIEDIFMGAYPGTPIEGLVGGKVVNLYSVRDMQQRLGPLITRMNQRLERHKQCIKPGKLKQTYCLSNLAG